MASSFPREVDLAYQTEPSRGLGAEEAVKKCFCASVKRNLEVVKGGGHTVLVLQY